MYVNRKTFIDHSSPLLRQESTFISPGPRLPHRHSTQPPIILYRLLLIPTISVYQDLLTVRYDVIHIYTYSSNRFNLHICPTTPFNPVVFNRYTISSYNSFTSHLILSVNPQRNLKTKSKENRLIFY